MSLRIRIRNRSQIALTRLREALDQRRAEIQRGGESDLTSIFTKLTESVERVLTKLREPAYDPDTILYDGDPNPERWNADLVNLETDLRALFREDREIKAARAEGLNAATITSRDLQERANYAASLITDLRLLAGQLEQDVLVVGDDFNNMDKIDTAFPLQYPAADVHIMQGVVMLHRLRAVNALTAGVKIQVAPLAPKEALKRDPTPDNSKRFYEGKFYAPVGEARPEGGKWHLEERVKPGITVPGASDVFSLKFDGGKEDPFADFPDLETEKSKRTEGFPLNPEDIVVIDRGATNAELEKVRQRMVDGDPETFWECEFILKKDQLDAYAFQKLEGQSTAATGNDQTETGPNDPQKEFTVVSPEELRARAIKEDVDETDFEVEIVFTLARRETLNFITITPMNFQETAWLEVTDVSTSANEDDAFHQIEGFGEQVFDNILTDEANTELTEDEKISTLAPSRSTYRGQGVYSFAPREVLRIRLRLRQRVPIPQNYERLAVQLNRSLTASSTSWEGPEPSMGI